MSFTSIRFVIFFPCIFILYYAVPFRFRKYLLLAASYYFYMCWKAEFIALIMISTAIDYFCGLGIEKYRGVKSRTKVFLTVSMCMNLGLLFFFKYMNFFGETLTAVCRAVSIPFSLPTLNIILPVGISFYTFQTMSYTIDVYRGKMDAEHDFITFALFVSFFPQLVAGPIEKAKNLLPQLKAEHPFNYENATYGLKLMAWGFFKKLVIADRLAAIYIDPVYQNLHSYTGGALVIATAAFAFQIYCDFSGYSDIAKGCARMMGIDLMVNFRAPYLSVSIREFWKRHHISLTDFFRDYVYIPLGGNKKGPWKRALFTTITFSLSGLWHGAGWNFVIWGLLHSTYMNIENALRTCLAARKKAGGGYIHNCCSLGKRILSWAITFALCSFAWIFFRAETMADAGYIIRHCLDGIGSPVQYCLNAYRDIGPGMYAFFVTVFALMLLLTYDIVNEKKDTIQAVSELPVYLRWPIYISFMLVLLLLMYQESTAPFIYFQF